MTSASPTGRRSGQPHGASARIDALDLEQKLVEVLDRWPSAGVAVGVVRDGSLEYC